MEMKYQGRTLPRIKRSRAYSQGRLPESEREADAAGMRAAGWTTLRHSTAVIVASSSDNPNRGDLMRRLNRMFNVTVKAQDKPKTTRGREAVNLENDPLFMALKAMPVVDREDGDWLSDGQEYSEDSARKMQSKIAAYAKAGAGTFRTSYNKATKLVYLKRISEEYIQQRGAA